MPPKPPRVFISYSHDSREHADRVRSLADALRGHGVDARIDQYEPNPKQGWPLWMETQLDDADFVLLICTQTYLDRVKRRQSAGTGHGVTWEATLIYNRLYIDPNLGAHYIPVLLAGAGLAEHIPEPARGFTNYRIASFVIEDTGYSALTHHLMRQLEHPMPPLGKPVKQISPRELELQYLNSLCAEDLLNTGKYTELSGTAHFRNNPIPVDLGPVVVRPEFVLFTRDRDQPREQRRFDDAVTEIRKLCRAVVLGEPGSGKTTTLWKLARHLADIALTDESAPVPLIVRLGRWTDAAQPLPAFIAQELGPLGPHWETLLAANRAALLLDGLNEVPAQQRRAEGSDKDAQVRRLISTHAEKNPDLIAVLSCRARDYTLDLGFDRIEIAPLDAPRIREFTHRYLGEEQGEALFWRLAGGDRIREIWGKWEEGGESLKQFFESTEVPKKVHLLWDDEIRWRWHVRSRPGSLMALAGNPYMLLMLAQVYVANAGTLPANRAALFRDFALTLLVREKLLEIDPSTRRPVMTAEVESLLSALARLAYEMQTERGDGNGAKEDDEDEEDGDALTVLPLPRALALLDEQRLYLAASASVLSVGSDVRFTHQLLQEYFAATHMRAEIEAGRLRAELLWPPDRWWERTN